MSSKDKEGITNKLKQFFRFSKGAAGNFKTRLDFALTPEIERDLSSEAPINVRCKAIRDIGEAVLHNTLEDRAIEKLWHCTQDLLNKEQPRDIRHLALGFLRCIVQSQTSSLALLRNHFFRVVQKHDIDEDAEPRLELLQSLIDDGKYLVYVEEEVGPFLLQWFPGLVSAGLTLPLLKIIMNLIKSNASFLNEETVTGIVQNACYLCCYSPITEVVLESLRILDSVVCYAIFPQESLGSFVACLCRTVNVEGYCATSWKVMRNLLGTHMGHNALYSMCRILQDPSMRSDKCLLRGAVFHVNMGLWGSKRVPQLKCSPCSVLPSLLQALESEQAVVTYEVNFAIERLVTKYGKELSEPTWDLILDILQAIAKHITMFPLDSKDMKVHFHQTVDFAEQLLIKQEFPGSNRRLYELIENCALDRPDSSLLGLMSYLSDRISPTQSMWLGALCSLMDRFYQHHPRTDIRLKALGVLRNVINKNRLAYEEDILERAVVPCLSTLHLEVDPVVRNAAAHLLISLCLTCESKRCLELLDILEKILNRPFELNQSDGYVVRTEAEMTDLKTVTNGLIEIFLTKMYQLPSSHAIRVYSILIGHVEMHYMRPKVFEISCCTRKPIFDCFLRVRSNASYHIGYPVSINSGIIKFSPYLGIERAVTSEVGSKTVASPTPNFPPNTQNVTCVSIKRGCKVIITCLKSERDWTVMNKVLEELPKVLQNKAIVLTRNTNDIELLASTLCNMLMDKSLGLPETLRNTDKLMRSDFHALVLPCLSALASYHYYLDSALQQRLIRCILRVGLVTRCSKQTITALTVLTLEMREPMVKLLPEVLLDLSKMSATVNIAVPILEFLSTLTRLPKVFANFVGDQYMAVFAISLPYTNPFRYNHYTVSLAHHVIAVWFLKCRLPFRRDFVKFITTGLKANAIIPFEEGRMLNKPDFINLNEDSSNRKRSSSLTEQGSRKRERPVIAATRPVGDLRPPMDESLLSFHIELTETCVDLMARHTFSPCSALPKRLPTADWLLSNGQSATWLVGHKLITITTSGCSHSPLKHGLCDRCLTSCKSSSDVVTPEPHVDNEPRRYSSSSLQHSGSGSEVRSGSGEGPQLLANRVAPPRQNSGGEKGSSLGPTLPENRRSSNPESSIEEDSSGAKGSKQPVAQAVDHVKMVDNMLGDQGHQSQQDKVDKQFCACWCQGWAEIYVRRPTGDMSWVMRIQNQVNYDTANSEFPLNDITSLFLPSIQTGHDIYQGQHGQGEIVDRLNSMSYSKSNDISEPSDSQKDTLMQLNNSLITNVIASGPINIPGSPARQLSNSSSEDQDNIENQDVAFDDQDSRMRNPVRRVNSSPEMSSNWKNPFLVRDKSDGSVIPAQDSSEEDCASKKSNKGFTKDMRVSCEAIPEEISGGNTPPSHPALLTLHSDPGEGSAHPETEQPLHSSTVPSTPVSLTSTDRLESNYAESKPNRFPNRVDPAVTLNLLNPALDVRKVTSKPPQAPPTTSPRSALREHNLDNMRQGSALKLPLPDLNENQDDSPRLRSKTISVMSPVRNSIRDNLKWPGGLMRGKETPPRSGINPSFVFLQLYHTAQFGSMSDKPIMVGSKAQTAVKLLDLIPPFETHKVGVLYVGPGQCNNETEILKNRFGSLRYAAFLRDLGTLVSLQDAPKHSLFIDLERNGQDGKFAYIWQDDVMQVTFHVATLMPNKSNDPFCNEKKKHIGNDFVSIVYNESGDEYQMQTIKGQFSYACVIVEPLELGTNRVTVRTRPELSEHIGHSDPKIISDSNVALLARQLALHVNLASMISRSLKNKGQVPYASNWLERLRKIKHLRSKLEPSSDKSNEKPEEKKPQQRVFMEDFTEYT